MKRTKKNKIIKKKLTQIHIDKLLNDYTNLIKVIVLKYF